MASMLDCLVSYFGLDEYDQPSDRRYFCYHVLAGPGPTADSGVAVIETVAIYDEAERCTYCKHFHTVKAGGPDAAMAAAVHYLDAYHASDHVRKVISATRSLSGEPLAGAFPPSEGASAHREIETFPPERSDARESIHSSCTAIRVGVKTRQIHGETSRHSDCRSDFSMDKR
jgi:hypothetical protein